ILVTHDQTEALALADRLAVLREGRIEQVGPPAEVYDRPLTRFVGQFLGTPPMNVLPCTLTLQGDDEAVVRLLSAEAGPGRAVQRSSPWLASLVARGEGAFELGIRAEHVVVGGELRAEPADAVLRVTGRVEHLESLGHESVATCSIGAGTSLRIRLSRASALRAGDAVPLGLDLRQAVWFDPATGGLLG
ncbi:MAG TPA: TOBE domain-containing protein, partial [Isosphaeraceae bacterium]|nr:TOBE domain-containing protein [Isosphaeraceae bacterium]